MHALKTGRLIARQRRRRAAACWAPRSVPGSRSTASRAELGLLFQIVDDILDVTGSEEEMGKPSGSRRATRQAHVRERLRPRAGARAGGELARPGARRRSRRRGRAARRTLRPRADDRLHVTRGTPDAAPTMTDASAPSALLDRVERSRGPEGARRGPAPAARAGGARVHHRHRRRDRRPLRRQPRHLRAGGRAAQRARLAARQDPLGRRPPGLSRTRC